MKKMICMMIVIVALLATAVPVALAADIGTSVTISTSGANIPVVKCKWEQDTTVGADLESGDVTHALYDTGANSVDSQFLPPLAKCATKTIYYYAVVTDAEDMGNVQQVWVDVFHPEGSPAPYSTSTDPLGPLFKYEIPFTKIGFDQASRDIVTDAFNAHLITFDPTFDLDEVIFEMTKGTAALWMGQAEIDYEQPAGDYKVECVAMDWDDNYSAPLVNYFEYVGVAAVEVDFDSINYGPVSIGVEVMRAGDTDFADPAPQPAGFGAANGATVRNIGNTWAHVVVTNDDMDFSKDVTGTWNVNFDARMGNDDAYKVIYMPEEETTLPNYLALSSQDELDFSIKVIKGTGTHTGMMTIGASIEPFSLSGTPVGIGGPECP
ncbi:MAG: hypothetical protein PHV74_07675 [Dehalococcoidia bacterium]|nr:hypothetical protein [Dehalococcoidia bacterium]